MTTGILYNNCSKIDDKIMNIPLVDIITSSDDTIRNLSLSEYCQGISSNNSSSATKKYLLQECEALDEFHRSSTNLYERVRALFFLYSIHRFHLSDLLPTKKSSSDPSYENIPFKGYQELLDRNFLKAINIFLDIHREEPNKAISSALAKAYYKLGFQTLADQVKVSVKNHPGNNWMFQVCDVNNHPKKIVSELLKEGKILCEQTPVRMDLSHCGWSDIFFLGMDFPDGARVLNVSIDLAVKGKHDSPIPPIESYLEIIDEPVLKLTSIDLKCSVTLKYIAEVFDFCKDYLGLLRAGIIASGIVPPGLESSSEPIASLFQTMIGRGCGLHLTTKVNDIPKGSRLAVSTNLLGSIISLCMRATGQTSQLTGSLKEEERRMVAARAILGEWLGGSGGGWQDSGGIWGGIKLIEGVCPEKNDPEYGLSRGRLLPKHRLLNSVEAPSTLIKSLQDSLILVHGGLAQNVGPILEMVTEKYLLRESLEWEARHESLNILDEILFSCKGNDMKELAKQTTKNFFGPLQTIVPWASNMYTETIIERTRKQFQNDFLGFWMLGGASGGGMGFIFNPEVKARALKGLQEIMLKTKLEMEHALPFAMNPVVYDFSINDSGTIASVCEKSPCLSQSSLTKEPSVKSAPSVEKNLDQILDQLGFDVDEHERIRINYKSGTIGLKQNRLPIDTLITNSLPEDVIIAKDVINGEIIDAGLSELEKGRVGVVTLAAGVGSRWTQGAGCVKALHPFCKLKGKHRSFLEVHLAKSRNISHRCKTYIPHVVTTSYMTDDPIREHLQRTNNHNYYGTLYQSLGKAIGVRLIPTVKDLRFAWNEKKQQKLDEQAQKIIESGQKALMEWTKSFGEGSDYRNNLPLQCLHPVGHYYEIPNLLLNGTLQKMIKERPQLQYLMLHNIDTVGADLDPGMLGLFMKNKVPLSFEVIPREIDDIGGGLARVDGKTRLVEGLALPREEDEFKFDYYNSMTTWIDIDKLLSLFDLRRADLNNMQLVTSSLQKFSKRIPTYAALKNVKHRWGNGQEDVFPTAQFEKLWSDISSLDDVECRFFVVSRERGAQLKEQAQLDGWLRDGSASYLESICCFEELEKMENAKVKSMRCYDDGLTTVSKYKRKREDSEETMIEQVVH